MNNRISKITMRAKQLGRVKLRRLLNLRKMAFYEFFYVEKTPCIYLHEPRKSRWIAGSYLKPCSYIEIRSCICLACTYSCTCKSSDNFVPVDIRPKPIKGPVERWIKFYIKYRYQNYQRSKN